MAMGEMTDYGRRLCEAMGLQDGGVPSIAAMRKFATDVGLSYQAIKKLFAKEEPRSNSMAAANNSKAARLLKVNPDWLATGEGTKELVFPRPEELQILRDIRVLEERDPEALAHFASLLHLNADSFRKTDAALTRHSGSNGYHSASNIKPAPPVQAPADKEPQKTKRGQKSKG